MSDRSHAEFGNILKSNSNGTFYSVSIEHANRNSRGFVDFEKMIGLDGVAIVNVVANPDKVALTGHKALQSRITHNDGIGILPKIIIELTFYSGGNWKWLTPPASDSNKQPYPCTSTVCLFLYVLGVACFLSSCRAVHYTFMATRSDGTHEPPTALRLFQG